MTIANAAPLGIFAFGVSCFVSGLFFMGIDADPPETTSKTVAYTQIMAGITLFIVTILFILGSQPVNQHFAMWAGAVFGYFAFLWVLMGLMILNGGDFRPFSSFLLYSVPICIVYALHSFQLGAKSFGILFILACAGTFLSWVGIRGWWAQALKVAGLIFVLLGFLGLYIALVEMLTGQAMKALLGG